MESTGGSADQDWFLLNQTPYSSCEVVVDGMTAGLGAVPVTVPGTELGVHLVYGGGLTIPSNSLGAPGAARALYFRNETGTAIDGDKVRVSNPACGTTCSAAEQYRIQLNDTTYSVPRYNNSATQISILIVQNTTARVVYFIAHFFDVNGTLVATHAQNLPPLGTLVLNTSTVPNVAGTSGAIVVNSDGRYGALGQGRVARAGHRLHVRHDDGAAFAVAPTEASAALPALVPTGRSLVPEACRRGDDRPTIAGVDLEVTMTRYAVAALLLLGLTTAAEAQGPPPTFEAAMTRSWKSVHDKILAMAKDTQYPEDKLQWKPHPDSRTVMQELRHVTIGLRVTSALARGEKLDFGALEKADDAKPKTRASVVSDMEAAIAESYPLVEKKPVPGLVGWLEHQGEHYGKMVTAYRVNGVVPPASRK